MTSEISPALGPRPSLLGSRGLVTSGSSNDGFPATAQEASNEDGSADAAPVHETGPFTVAATDPRLAASATDAPPAPRNGVQPTTGMPDSLRERAQAQVMPAEFHGRLPCWIKVMLGLLCIMVLGGGMGAKMGSALGSSGRQALTMVVLLASLLFAMMLLGLATSAFRDSIDEHRQTHWLFPTHAAIFGGATMGAVLAMGTAWAVLPHFQRSPLSLASSDSVDVFGFALPACYAGRWFTVDVQEPLAFVCEAPVPRHIPDGGLLSYDGHTAYYRPDFMLSYEQAERACLGEHAQLARVSSAEENDSVRRICGARECWIDGWANFSAFTNWERGEPATEVRPGIAVKMNSEEFCSFLLYSDGGKAHWTFVFCCQLLALLGACCHVTLSVGSLVFTRQIVHENDLTILRCLRRLNGVVSGCITMELCVALFAFIAVLAGYFVVSDGTDTNGDNADFPGYPPGGPVLCQADADHLGFGTAESCEGSFTFYVAAFLAVSMLLLLCQLALCNMARRSAGHLHKRLLGPADRSGGPAGLFPPVMEDARCGPIVIGTPVLTVPSDPVAVAVGAAEGLGPQAAESWDPELPAILERLRLSMLSTGMSPQVVFQQLDPASLGLLSPVVFEAFVRSWEPNLRRHHVSGLWRRADANGDGQVDLPEFYAFLGQLAVRLPHEAVRVPGNEAPPEAFPVSSSSRTSSPMSSRLTGGDTVPLTTDAELPQGLGDDS